MRYSESEVNHALTRLFRWGYLCSPYAPGARHRG
jgi:hypothetical protein